MREGGAPTQNRNQTAHRAEAANAARRKCGEAERADARAGD